MATENLDMDYSKYDFKDSTEMYVHLSKKGLTKDTVREISQMKEEPESSGNTSGRIMRVSLGLEVTKRH